MLLIAPGWTRQTPVVATVSGLPLDRARGLDGQHGFRGGAQGIAPAGHQDRAGVSAFALPGDPQRRRGRDRRDDADRDAGPFEERALFDVQLDEGGEVPLGEPDLRQLALEPGGAADLVERAALRVAQRRHRLGRQRPGRAPGCPGSRCRTGSALRW